MSSLSKQARSSHTHVRPLRNPVQARMETGGDLTLHDRLHFSGELIAVGSVRLAPGQRAWNRARALEHHHVVLPRTAMGIRQGGQPVFVADPLHLTLHNPGVPYRREAIGANGDHSDYLMLHPDLAAELLGRRARFACGQNALNAQSYLALRWLIRLAERGTDALQVEEAALAWLARMDTRGGPVNGGAAGPVMRARRVLAEHWREGLTVSELARAAHVSPFHLARRFRAQTGLTLHGYRMALKARAALAEIDGHVGQLDGLARSLGYVDLPARCGAPLASRPATGLRGCR
jgi:AraC-like DNA-binding protein